MFFLTSNSLTERNKNKVDGVIRRLLYLSMQGDSLKDFTENVLTIRLTGTVEMFGEDFI